MIERLKESFGPAIGFKVVGRITGDEVKAFEPQIEFVIAERKERPIGILADLSQMEDADWKARWSSLELPFFKPRPAISRPPRSMLPGSGSEPARTRIASRYEPCMKAKVS